MTRVSKILMFMLVNVGLYNYGTLVVKYKGEVIDVFNNNQILNDDYEKRLLKQRIEQLENK